MAAEAIVSTVLEQLFSIIGREVEQDARLVTSVRKEIGKLTSNFQAIQAVLIDAEQRQVKETAVGVWLDKLKDVSYDLDDVLDEWNTAILKLQIERVEKAQIPEKKVRFRFFSPCIPFRQVASRPNIGVKIKEINEILHVIAREKFFFNFNVIGSIEEPQRLGSTSFIEEVSEIHGRDEEKDTLLNKLLSESKQERARLPVISIIGMGGIGKTTLARLAYNDANIRTKFDSLIWVCVSYPFDEVRIARAIIEGLSGQATNLVEFQSLLECIHDTVANKKFLLVLDDVWTENYGQWEALYNSLNNGLHGESKILVTTRKMTVAKMMKSIDVIVIEELSREESWSLFNRLAFFDRSPEECEKLENIGRELVYKCKGFPLAIKAIGSLLQFKKTRDQWQRILYSEMWRLEEFERGIFPPLLLSYNDLPGMVKRCFSYCAIFPKDYEMEKYELIRLWMAQGYLGFEHDEEIEIIGEEYFDTLVMRSFFYEFQKDADGNIYACKMHDIVHDFAQHLTKNECFSKEIYSGEEASLDVSCEKARHLMLILKSSYHVNISNVQKLRSFLIECESRSQSMGSFSPYLFEELTCLRALKLRISWDNKIPSKIGNLIHLRYLNMSGLNIKELPESLCCLYNLQTLNISYCWFLEKLPQGMGKLINLRHLINRSTQDLRYMPKEMERLVCLRTLDKFIVGGDPNGMGLGCLKNFNELRGCLLLEGLGNVVDEVEATDAQLLNKKNLVDLRLYFSSESDIDLVEEGNKDSTVLEALQPPPNLETLLIDGCRSITLSPHWIVSLIHLKTLFLQSCRKCEYLPALGKLPRLEYLEISEMDSVTNVGNEFVGMENIDISSSSSSSLIAFPKLKTLSIQYMDNWVDWEYKITGDITVMPSLCTLHIIDCPELKSLPDHLLLATSLEQLNIKYSKILEERYMVESGRLAMRSRDGDYAVRDGCRSITLSPHWMVSLIHLKKLFLQSCRKCENLPALGKLPLLEYLEISEMESVKRVGNEFLGMENIDTASSSLSSLIAFPKLKRLSIQYMDNWEDWEYKITGDITIMPSLSTLHIVDCPKLNSLPDHLLHAISLEQLDIKYSKILEERYMVESGRLAMRSRDGDYAVRK